MTRPQPDAFTPRTQLLAVALLLLVSLVFWDSVVLAPVKLFVVLLHELCHGGAAILTGGEIVRIDIDPRIGGTCLTRGGWDLFVVSSGYIGSLLLGAGILLLARRPGAARVLAWGIGLAVLGVTFAFVRNAFGLLFGAAFGAGLIALARFLPRRFLDIALLYLGAMSALYAVVDVKEDLLTLEPRLTDAAILASMTGFPAIFWGILWSALSLLVLFLLFRFLLRTTLTRTQAPR